MDISSFTDKGATPTPGAVADKLGATYPLWQHIAVYVHSKIPGALEEWNYGGVKYGWSFRIKDKKRVVVYLLPREGFFKVAMVFGQKAVDMVMSADIAGSIKTELANAKPYAEGRGIRIDVKSKKLLRDITRLIDIKMT